MSKKITINGKKYKMKPEKTEGSCVGCDLISKNQNICLTIPDCTGFIVKKVKRKGGK